jgi:putative intracellular protease/amidase
MPRFLLLLFALLLPFPLLAQGTEPAARAAADAAFAARDWEKAAAAYAALAGADGAADADATVLYRAGYALHALGRLDDAMRWHQRAAALHTKEPRLAAIATYNIACVHARQGRPDAAFAALDLAAARGFRRAAAVQRDPDLAALRGDPRLAAVVAKMEALVPLVAVVVHDGVETLDFAGPIEVFTSARSDDGDPLYRVRLVAPAAGPVRPQHWQATIAPDFSITDCPQPAVLVIPGGDTRVLEGDVAFVDWVKRTAPKCETVLSVCTGAFVLAKAGLLDGREATTFHGARPALQQRYPALKVVDRKVVDSGACVTAAGVSSGIDGALHVVQRTHGLPCAKRVAEYIEYAWQPLPEAPPAKVR